MYCIISPFTAVLEEVPHLPTSFSGGPSASFLCWRNSQWALGSLKVGPGTLTPLQSLKRFLRKMQGYVGNILLKNIPRVSSLSIKGWAPEGSSEDAIGKGTLGTDLSVVLGFLAPPFHHLYRFCVTATWLHLGPSLDHDPSSVTTDRVIWRQGHCPGVRLQLLACVILDKQGCPYPL